MSVLLTFLFIVGFILYIVGMDWTYDLSGRHPRWHGIAMLALALVMMASGFTALVYWIASNTSSSVHEWKGGRGEATVCRHEERTEYNAATKSNETVLYTVCE